MIKQKANVHKALEKTYILNMKNTVATQSMKIIGKWNWLRVDGKFSVHLLNCIYQNGNFGTTKIAFELGEIDTLGRHIFKDN